MVYSRSRAGVAWDRRRHCAAKTQEKRRATMTDGGSTLCEDRGESVEPPHLDPSG